MDERFDGPYELQLVRADSFWIRPRVLEQIEEALSRLDDDAHRADVASLLGEKLAGKEIRELSDVPADLLRFLRL